MKITHIAPAPLRGLHRLQPPEIAFAAFAAVALVAMLSFYVQLVNESVARGARLRYEQTSAISPANASDAKMLTVSFGTVPR